MSNCNYPSKNFGEQTPREVLECTKDKISETTATLEGSINAMKNPSTATMNDYINVIWIAIAGILIYSWISNRV